jgi:hypothetical protein
MLAYFTEAINYTHESLITLMPEFRPPKTYKISLISHMHALRNGIVNGAVIEVQEFVVKV